MSGARCARAHSLGGPRRTGTAPLDSALGKSFTTRQILSLAWGERAPSPVALRADSHCTYCGSTRAFPRTLAHDDVWTTPPHPRPRQERERRSAPCTERLEQREAQDVFDVPITKRQRAQVIGGGGTHVGARARSAHAFGAERVARGGDLAATAHRRPGAQRPRHRRRARSARRRWQPAAAPPAAHTGAQRALCARSAVRRARSATWRSGSPQAPGTQRPRHGRRARSARRRQLACWRSHSTRWDVGGLCLLARATLYNNISQIYQADSLVVHSVSSHTVWSETRERFGRHMARAWLN